MTEIKDLKKRVEALKAKLDIEALRKKIRRIEADSAKPDFWQDQEKATGEMKQLARFQEDIEAIEKLEELIKEQKVESIEKGLKKLEIRLFFSGKYDSSQALLSIHAGQGGVEAMDWAQMLERMYVKYFERRNWDFEILSENSGEEAGIKNVTLGVNEPLAYGFLKFEAGTHRLVRQSPFNADQLRQTSFALVEVLPQVGKKQETDISNEDLGWQFYRASTQGGQNVQKVSTAVRLIHKPTNIVVTCERERSQEQNRKIALKLLRAKLWQKEEERRAIEVKKLKGGKTKAAWGTQIRSYVLHPYKMVKDLRTKVELRDAEAVLDGRLNELIEAEIRQLSKIPE